MKKLLLLVLAASIVVLFVACDKDEMDVNVKSTPKGEANYKFSGKTFVAVNPEYIHMEKTTTVISGTTTTTTIQRIPLATRTYSITFNDDGTFSYTVTTAFTTGMDAAYVNNAAAGITYTGSGLANVGFTSFNPTEGSPSNNSHSGYANQQYLVGTYTGTWETYENKANNDKSQTLGYLLNIEQSTSMQTNPNYSQVMYTVTSTSTSSQTFSIDDPNFQETLSYTYMGKDELGNVKYYIGSSGGTITNVIYTEQAE